MIIEETNRCMNWIKINNNDEIPIESGIIVEDCNGWIGQARYNGSAWVLETFDQTLAIIEFDKIIKYCII